MAIKLNQLYTIVNTGDNALDGHFCKPIGYIGAMDTYIVLLSAPIKKYNELHSGILLSEACLDEPSQQTA